MSRISRTQKIAASVSLAAAALLVVAWGDAGHRMIGEAAALRMPGSTPGFFRAASRQLAYLNPEPDRWKDRNERNADPALEGGTSPEHFIDMDMAPPAVLAGALKAPNRYAYADSLRAGGVNPTVFGYLPFRMLELAQQLR